MTKRNAGTSAIGALAANLGLTNVFGSGAGNAGAAEAAPSEGAHVCFTDQDWRQRLTPEQFRVLREHGTERAGTSPLDREKRAGTFACVGCGQPLFSSEAKFNSGTGWPSFYKPVEGAVETSTDTSLFMTRTEVHCAECKGHLGHVFEDGPPPTGLRYCINGAAMSFTPQVE